MKHVKYDITGIPASNASSTPPRHCADLRHKTVQVKTADMTAQVEGTIDGTNWVAIGAVVAANGGALVQVDQSITHVRITIAAFVSGATTAVIGGFDARTE